LDPRLATTVTRHETMRDRSAAFDTRFDRDGDARVVPLDAAAKG
jgi:hypothetical protein